MEERCRAMSFREEEIAGRVALPPHESQLQPRTHDVGGRNLPMVTLRLEADDGAVYNVTYMGEMDGQVSQGDLLVLRGFSRGPGVFRATEVWLRGRMDSQGNLAGVDPPARLAKKAVCVVASSLFGPESHEVTILTAFRDHALSRSAVGRGGVRLYYYVSPWIVVKVLERSPLLRRMLQGAIHMGLRWSRGRA